MPTAATSNTATLPTGIEIFRAGRHTDDTGNVHVFSAADLRRMAEVYDPTQREAPLTIGHPEHDLPAYGYVRGLALNEAGRLAMDTYQVAPQFAELVRDGRFKKRSAAFYPPSHPNNPTPGAWYLRHVAFLGAQPPAVSGLADIQFSESDAAGLVQFSESTTSPPQEPTTMDKELQAQLDAANQAAANEKAAREQAEADAAAAKAQLAQFAEQARTTRRAGFVAFCESHVNVLLPKGKDMAVAALDVLADAQPVSFSEGGTTRTVSLVQWLQDLIASHKPVVEFGEFAPGNTGTATAGSAKGKSDAEIDSAAKHYAAQHKVSYAEALNAVVSFTS